MAFQCATGVIDVEALNEDASSADCLEALEFAKKQYQDVTSYVKSIDSTKTIHIGESGWTTISDGHYGKKSSRAADEYKAGSFYKMMREWTNKEKISLNQKFGTKLG